MKRLIALITLLLAFSVLLPATFAQSNEIGTITVSYTLTGSGTGSDSGSGSGETASRNDTVSVSLSGQQQFAVLQTGPTNFSIGNQVSGFNDSNVTCSVSGQFQGDDSVYGSFDTPYVAGYVEGWYFGSTAVSNQINGNAYVSVGASVDGTTNYDDDISDGLGYGVQAAQNAMDGCVLLVTLTNTSSSWNWNFSTNVSISTNGVTYFTGFTDNYSAQGSGSLTGTLSFAPIPVTVAYTASDTNGTLPFTVQFNAQATDSATNPIVAWNWNFGDDSTNATSTNQNPSHVYYTNGTFTVTLTATNSNGTLVTGLGPTNIVVTGSAAEFTASTTNGIMPLLVQFYGPSEDSAGNSIIAWSWDLGDNSFSTSQNPEQTYLSTKSQAYSPKLTVTNILGAVIQATGPQIFAYYPLVAFTASPSNGPVPLSVQFNAPAQDPLLVGITNWQWTFGDGTTSTNQSPSHTYTNAGLYSVTLIVTNVNGVGVAGVGPHVSAGCAPVYSFDTGGSGYSPVNYALTNSDGVHAYAGLTSSGSQLYGVMSGGGVNGAGTIFSINADGSGFTNLYQFSAQVQGYNTNSDGATPESQLVLSGGTLYGTTSSGGTQNGGTVFSVSTNGANFTNLYNFSSSGGSGYFPGGLMLNNGTLYGPAEYGGDYNEGTLFKLGANGSAFTQIHEFSAETINPNNYLFTNADGAYPDGALLAAGNNPVVLYGTASQGGLAGSGTIFTLAANGANFTVLHNFTNTDGEYPQGVLLLSGNTLYGVTRSGGPAGNGTVFKVNTDGSGFATLHYFSTAGYNPLNLTETNSDGANPQAGLVLNGGMLYGTTASGGPNGSGTIFEVDTNTGADFAILYDFSATIENTVTYAHTNLDGASPYGALAVDGQMVYATTYAGGEAGEGAIFAVDLASSASGAPSLNIQVNGSTVVISWPDSATGWTLQQSSNLGTGNWTASGLSVSDNGTVNSVTITLPSGGLFFRLEHP